jgi:hypothetical protein
VQIEQHTRQVDEILASHQNDVGDLFPAYRNHVCRVLNYCFALRELSADPCSDEERQKLIIAGCFHDLGIWPEGTLAYLEPSIALANEYLAENGKTEWSNEIGRIIDQHHKIRAVRGDASPLVELFRRADLIDVSLGLQRFGLPRSFVKQVTSEFPNLGFHKALARLGVKQLIRSPWNPMPMIKW